ncbi:PhnD/SsuA/transferrin family substrate-binding protein [Enhygromyxa salina]|uniref:PhnD/SsuA/transferrin family substrate-binding protein n=1 Tax=Enhygromyxa salina TaxID=215803 RepID=UPI0006969D08|nr:PhnD/SsuA/transferrin family substrate-binding protein [Enhygromyxa salina]
MIRNACCATFLAALALAPIAADAGEGGVNVLILKEHGVGSAASAQQYVDNLLAHVARQNKWPSAAGQYLTSRSTAAQWIGANSPHYGILSLAAFLDLRGKHKLEVIGSAEVTGGGGHQYFVVSASETSLAGCKGKTLGTDHGDDTKFIDKVVGRSDFSLSDFTVEDTRRPMKTVNAVARGEVACALIDDAQLASLAKADGGAAVKTVWSSRELPDMAVVAFPSAPASEKASFKKTLAAVCTGDGAAACKEVGLRSLEPAGESAYADVIKDYQ